MRLPSWGRRENSAMAVAGSLRRFGAWMADPNKRASRMSSFRRHSIRTLQFFCVINMVQEYVCEVSTCTGASMLPTLSYEGDLVLHLKLPFYKRIAHLLPDKVGGGRGHLTPDIGGVKGKLDPAMSTGIAVGDLVVSVSPNDPSRFVCKRILGLAGDTVLLDPRVEPSDEHASLWQQGRNAKDTNVVGLSNDKGQAQYIVIPKGHVWLCGDNLANSTDSRHYGPVPLGLIRGRVIARVSKHRLRHTVW